MEEKTDLRIRKPYKALCDAFVTILEKKRFDDLTVNELCDEAMIRCAATSGKQVLSSRYKREPAKTDGIRKLCPVLYEK